MMSDNLSGRMSVPAFRRHETLKTALELTRRLDAHQVAKFGADDLDADRQPRFGQPGRGDGGRQVGDRGESTPKGRISRRNRASLHDDLSLVPCVLGIMR